MLTFIGVLIILRDHLVEILEVKLEKGRETVLGY